MQNSTPPQVLSWEFSEISRTAILKKLRREKLNNFLVFPNFFDLFTFPINFFHECWFKSRNSANATEAYRILRYTEYLRIALSVFGLYFRYLRILPIYFHLSLSISPFITVNISGVYRWFSHELLLNIFECIFTLLLLLFLIWVL